MASETSVDNGYVVVWQQHSNSTGHRLAGKTIDVDGNPLGDFFFIGQQTFRPFEPAVSSLADGSYVVIWRGDTRYYDDLEGHALLGQIYNPDGSPKGEEIVVSTDHHSTNTSLSVTATANGGFVTTWTSYGVENDSQEDSFGISGQLFSRDGEKIGDSFLVNTNTNRSQQYSDVTTLSNGRFVVTWESDDPEIAGSYTTWDNNIGIYRGISGQIFSASGEPIGDEFRVNTFTQGTQSTPVVSPLESGGFVVAWSGFNSLESDGPVTNQGITAQVFDGNGKRIGDEISVNTYERWFQENPSAVGLSNGGFVITWTSSSDVSGQLFDAHYNPIGSEFTVNTSVEHSQGDSATVAVEDGGFIVTWTDLGGMSTAGSIAGQRFDATGNKIGEQFSIASPYGRVGASDIARLLPVSSTLLESNDVNIAIYEDENFVKFEVGDSKPENNSLTYIISDGLPENQGNVVNNNDGTFTFLPGDDFKSLTEDQAQDVTFTYIVTDSAGNTSSPATVTITVNGVDHLPEADDYSSTGREDDTSITGTLTATDEDGGDLSYALVDAPSKGSVTVTQDGNFSFEPGDDFDDLGAGESRDITFTYVATDPEGNTSNPGTVTVTIAGINQQPIVTAVAISGTEDDAGISSSVIGTDPEGGELTYSLLEAPAEGSVEFGTDGNFTFVPGDDFKDLADGESRDVSFTYIATDEHGATSDPELVTVTVSGINHAPVVSNVTTTGSREDNEITGGLLGTDEDGDDLTFNLVDAPTEGSVVFDGNGLFSFSPGSDFDDLAEGESREISFTYTATDEIGLTSDPASVTITVSDKPEGFVAVWSSYREDAEGWGVFGQYYEADGTAAGDIFQVNTTEVKSQDEPAITSLNDGGFVVTWTSEGQDGSRDTIIGQRFNAQGVKVGDEFQINTFTDASQSSSVVSGLADGGFVVSWVSDGQDGGSKGVFGQRFDSHGDTLGDEFQINSYSKRDQFDPEVTSLSNGGYVMAWTSYAQDGHGYGVYAQQFDAFGARVGDEFLVNSHTRGSQAQPKMTALEDGGFVAVWQSDRQDSSREGIFGQRFDDQGNRVGDEFSVNSTTQGAQISPAIASFASGAFVVTWASAGQDGSGLGIFAQRFDADGAQLGGEFLVNTTTNYSQSAPQVSVLEDGSFVISWTSDRQDGSGKGVFGQRFDADGNIVGDEFQINDHNRFDQTDVAITALRRDSDEPLNHAPTVEDIALTLGEDDAAASIDFSGTDAEGSDLTFTLTSDPVLGSVTNNEDGSFTFDPEDDFQLLNDGESSEVSFTYTATDELGKTSAEGTVTVNVTGQDDIDPTNLFKITSTNFAETDDLLAAVQAEFGADYVLADWQDIVRAYNEFGEAYFEDLMSGQEVMITKDGENFLEEHAGRQYLVADHDGSVPTNWGVHDHINGNDLSLGSWYGLNLPVMAVHEDYAPLNYTSTTPEVADINIIASEGYAVEANFAGSDANLDNLTFELTSLPDQGTVINNNDGSFSFQLEDASDLNSGESAQTSFTYKACDGENSSDNANVSITLTGQDQLLEGGFVVAWSSFRQDGGDWGIYGQRYDADGNTFGDEFLINSITTNCQTEPAITSLSDGGFVVSWTSMNEDGSGSGVFAQRYGVDGNTDGAVIQVNSYTEGVQGNSALAATSDGGFVAVWNSTHQDGSNKGVFGQRFNVEGEATGDEFQINTFSRWDQHDPAITMLANDGFVVSWTSLAQDGRGWGIFGQQFDSDGNAQGTEFQINTYTRNNQTESSITALSDGGFVVTWESDRQDGSGRGIYGQRFDANGDSQGGEFLINTETSGNQTAPVVTDLDDGGFIVVWSSSNQDGSGNGIYGQRFDSDAQALGEEFQINTETSRSQDDASVAALDEGGFVVTWHSDSQDGSGGGVFGQRFDTDGNTIGGEFQVNSYTHMHQADAVVTGLNSDDLISEPTSFMFTSTIYSNGNQIDVLDSDDSFQLSQLAEEITGIDTVDLSGTETNSVQISEAALLARTDDDDTLFVTGDFGDSVNLTGDGWAQINPVETYSVATDWFTNGDAIVVVDQALDIQSEYDLLDLTV